MKPTAEQNNLSKRADVARKNAFPSIDCNYQTVALPSYRGGCLQPRFSSFRNISGEYFRNEAQRSASTSSQVSAEQSRCVTVKLSWRDPSLRAGLAFSLGMTVSLKRQLFPE